MTARHQVIFEPLGRRVELSAGETLLTAAQKAGIGLIAVCDGLGTCQQCILRIVSGDVTPPNEIEQAAISNSKLASGFRLACQAVPTSNVTVDIPPESTSTRQRLQVEGLEESYTPAPVIEAVEIAFEPAARLNKFSSKEQFIRALIARYPAAQIIPALLERLPFSGKNIRQPLRLAMHATGRVVGILAAGQQLYGLALDIGTTKLAAYLVNLEDGKILAKGGIPNPQIAYGEDVISRIAYANRGTTETTRLQKTLADGINDLVMEICRAEKIDSRDILDALAVGNTAMHHLLIGLPTRQLGEAPYAPAHCEPTDLPVDKPGLKLSPGALIHFPPVIAGFVGADHIAADLACGLTGPGENTLLVDIGTNTEITLRTPAGLSCCSCASGPAFEGAHIHAGMRAAAGAIERVFHDRQGWHYQTIDNLAPVGICGSGILDAVAEMFKAGIIDTRGSIKKDNEGVVHIAQGWAFRLADSAPGSRLEGIHITRRDVNEVQLAKAAIRAGIEILLRENNLKAEQVNQFFVAGAFGTYLSLASALAIGMFPELPLDRFHQVGNAAGAGARMMLVSKKARQEAISLQRTMKYVELTTITDFQEFYMAALPISAHLVFPAA